MPGSRARSASTIRATTEPLKGPVTDTQHRGIGLREVARVSDRAIELGQRPPRTLEQKPIPPASARPGASFGRTAHAPARAPSRGSHATAVTATYATAPPPGRNAAPPPQPRNNAADATQPKSPPAPILNLAPTRGQRAGHSRTRRAGTKPLRSRPSQSGSAEGQAEPVQLPMVVIVGGAGRDERLGGLRQFQLLGQAGEGVLLELVDPLPADAEVLAYRLD